ncbi:hypothetical protein KDI_13210 [Dictyobacter arantiisoli]|uniref:Uncharacterized protein n=1 Tax=Dictyobacter arantiisoli TaxID=2014874 RepID=A0A5A5T8T4_9CHLR|nr:hypothetical protein KDI_13210 [Dictyobacter arantiisoli]
MFEEILNITPDVVVELLTPRSVCAFQAFGTCKLKPNLGSTYVYVEEDAYALLNNPVKQGANSKIKRREKQ